MYERPAPTARFGPVAGAYRPFMDDDPPSYTRLWWGFFPAYMEWMRLPVIAENIVLDPTWRDHFDPTVPHFIDAQAKMALQFDAANRWADEHGR